MGQRNARRGLRGSAGRQARGAPSGGTRLQKGGAAPLSKGGAQTAGFAALPHGLPEDEAQGLPLPGLCGVLCRAAGEFGRAAFFFFPAGVLPAHCAAVPLARRPARAARPYFPAAGRPPWHGPGKAVRHHCRLRRGIFAPYAREYHASPFPA